METTVINKVAVSAWSEPQTEGSVFWVESWQEVVIQQMWLICWLFGGFHACRKRERKTNYRRRYRVSRSRDSFFCCETILTRNCRPGDLAFKHWLKLVSVQVIIWTSVEDECGRVVLSDVWSSRLVKSCECFDDNLFKAWVGHHHCLVNPRTVNTASWTTIYFHEVNWQLVKTVRSSSLRV